MASSTSHSDGRFPWQPVRLGTVALVVWALSALYSLRLNPEVAFYRHGDHVKQDWVRKLENEHGSKIVIFGGSSCAASIDGERMLQKHGLAVANLGLGAGMGAKILTRYALQSLRPGDGLIIALEQDLLMDSLQLQPLGVQFSLATGNAPLLRDPDSIDWPRRLFDLRPGSYHAFTLVGKVLARQPLYRYQPEQFHASGWQEIVARREIKSLTRYRARLSNDGREWMAFIRQYCAAHNVRVAYLLPWAYVSPDNAAGYQRDNIEFIRQIAGFVSVLKEPRLGTYSVREHFGDTELHLTAEGAALRTDELARCLANWETWSLSELDQMLKDEKRFPSAPAQSKDRSEPPIPN